jgi:hypothetical protein
MWQLFLGWLATSRRRAYGWQAKDPSAAEPQPNPGMHFLTQRSPKTQRSLVKHRENLYEIYVWLMSLPSVLLWQKRPFKLATKDHKDNSLVLSVLFCGKKRRGPFATVAPLA